MWHNNLGCSVRVRQGAALDRNDNDELQGGCMSTKELGQGLTRPPFNDEEKSLSVPPGVCSLPLFALSPNNVSSMTDLGFVANPPRQ